MKCTTLAEVLSEASRVANEIEGTDLQICDCIKHDGGTTSCLFLTPEGYEFMHQLLEGKPVFTGAVLYSPSVGRDYVVKANGYTQCEKPWGLSYSMPIEECTWTKPEPVKEAEKVKFTICVEKVSLDFACLQVEGKRYHLREGDTFNVVFD